MARRVEADLLLGMLALQEGSVDPADLVSAFEVWTRSLDRTMAAVLVDLGLIDEDRRRVLEALVARHSSMASAACIEPEPETGVRELHGIDPELTVAQGGEAGERTDASEPTDPDEVESRVGRFRIIRSHAQGGLGEVSLAHDPDLDRVVALKELRGDHAEDAVSRSRFLREAGLTGRLEHPGIVPIYAMGLHPDGRPYYAMRFIEGENLREAIERFHVAEGPARDPSERALSFRRLLRSVIEACNAVAYAHSRGIIHRDLKPDNIMLGRFGETMVVDWGIAKSLDESTPDPSGANSPLTQERNQDAALTHPGATIGTPQYMSPEQAAGDAGRVCRASDVYGLGATLCCVLVGHAPFADGGIAAVLRRASRGIFPAPRRLRRSVDPELERICLKAMAPRPEDRHASPLELAGEIEAWLADVRYRGEQEHALAEVKESKARLCLERAHNHFGREQHGEGLLWMARSLEQVATDSPVLERAIRASIAGWHGRAKLAGRGLVHRSPVQSLAFSLDGKRLLTGSADGSARIWDMAQGSLLTKPLNLGGSVNALAVGPDGRWFVTATNHGLLRHDLLTGEPIGELITVDPPLLAMTIIPDGSMIAIASRRRTPWLWDLARSEAIHLPGRTDNPISAFACSPDGRVLAAVDNTGAILMWEIESRESLGDPLSSEATVLSLCFGPDGHRLVSGCQDGKARVWDVNTGALRAELSHQAEICTIAYSSSGKRIATGCRDGSARLWDPDDGRPIGEPMVHQGNTELLRFDPEGTILASAGADGSASLWDAATGVPIGPPLKHRGRLLAFAFSPDGRRLATGSADGVARCWNIPQPMAGDLERISCWIRVEVGLDFDEGEAIRPLDHLTGWELRRRLQELGGSPIRKH